MTLNANALQGVKGKKIVLNQCLLSKSDIQNFEYESKLLFPIYAFSFSII